jgi:hypothetical protein
LGKNLLFTVMTLLYFSFLTRYMDSSLAILPDSGKLLAAIAGGRQAIAQYGSVAGPTGSRSVGRSGNLARSLSTTAQLLQIVTMSWPCLHWKPPLPESKVVYDFALRMLGSANSWRGYHLPVSRKPQSGRRARPTA